MDETDARILEILKDNGRESFTEIAEQVGVSEGTIRNRVEDMKEDGVIRRFTVETGREMMKGFVMIDVSTDHTIESIVEEVDSIRLYELAGRHDAIAVIEGQDSEEVNERVDLIRAVDGVESTETYLVLNELD
jgi:DNA-binding Lrp family transcriptional regulator